MNDEPTDDLDPPITDHPFESARFKDAFPGICGHLVDGWPCGFERADHLDPGEGS